MANRALNILSSLKLTVVLLTLSMLLVFFGTIAQVKLGLYVAQEAYFKSFFVYWSPEGSNFKLPVLPGGYLIGSVLLVNLLAAHWKRFEFTSKKAGIFLVHAGLILLLLGQLFTDLLSTESAMQLVVGETKNYSEDFQHNEMVVIDGSKAETDKVVAIPDKLLARKREVQHADLPFTIKTKEYWPNSDISTNAMAGFDLSGATEGFGKTAYVRGLPIGAKMDDRNLPSALVELQGPKGPLGTWLITTLTTTKQTVNVDGKDYQIGLRFKRHYTDHQITLLECTHELYQGTGVPKNFSSRVRIDNPTKVEKSETQIYMNNPLRYAGLTYYQYQMGQGGPNGKAEHSTFQVVRNPSWLTPYLACIMVGLGLIVQFMMHFVKFTRRNAGQGKPPGAESQARPTSVKKRKSEPEAATVAATALPANRRNA